MCNVVRLLCSSIGFCFLLGSAGAFAQDDRFEFKGAKLGISQSEFMEKFSFMNCNAKTRTPMSDVLCIGIVRVECDTTIPSSNGASLCVGGTYKDFQFGGKTARSFMATFYNDALASVHIKTGADGFDTVTAALIEKYGKPNAVKTEALQTKIGATYQNITMTWRRSDSSIVATKFSGDINTSRITYKLNSADNEIKKRSEEESKKNASDL